jgi:hypothetical protein
VIGDWRCVSIETFRRVFIRIPGLVFHNGVLWFRYEKVGVLMPGHAFLRVA